MRREQIPYGVKDFKRVRLENFHYVVKSSFIEPVDEIVHFSATNALEGVRL